MDIKQLEKLIKHKNIAETLSKEELNKIGSKVVDEYEVDLESRSEIDKVNEEAMKLAKQTPEAKSFPWEGAASIKYPLVTVASIQFASRAFPEIVPDEKITGFKIIGADPDKAKENRAKSVSEYMDYQLTEEMDGWLDSTDRLLHVLPIVGTCFKKVYYDSIDKVVTSKFLTYNDVVVNKNAENLKKARRVTHKFYKYKNYAVEMHNANIWLNSDLGYASLDEETEGEVQSDAPHLFLEQHRWLDLDNDGYEEPYIVTVHKNSRKVLRIVARYDENGVVFKNGKFVKINPIHYFIKYPFIPNPDGGFYDTGFGSLLYPINESLNTAINQLLDGGTLANTGGGFLGRGIKIGAGTVNFKPGEWKKTDVMGQDLKQGIVPLPTKEPSQVLFQLLGLLINAGRDISSVQEAMAGQKPGENVSAATVTALIEQGLKVFSGIYKRIYRSLTEELKLIFQLNSKYAEYQKYYEVIDRKISRDDFNTSDFDISPNASPVFSLESQRTARAQALLEISGRPGLDEDAITADYLAAIKAPEERLIPKEERPKPPMDIEKAEFQLKLEKLGLEKDKLMAEITALVSKGIKDIATAEEKEEGKQLEEYKRFLEDLGEKLTKSEGKNEQGRVRGMETKPGNQGSPQQSQRPAQAVR